MREKRGKIAVRVDEDGENDGKGGAEREELDEGELGGGKRPSLDEERDEGGHVDESLNGLLQRTANLRSAAETIRRRVDSLRSADQHGADHLYDAMLQQIVGVCDGELQKGQPIGFRHVQRAFEARGDLGNRFEERGGRGRLPEIGSQAFIGGFPEGRRGQEG